MANKTIEDKEQKKEIDQIWNIGRIATQTEVVIVNSVTNEQLDIPSALVKILNGLEELKKLL